MGVVFLDERYKPVRLESPISSFLSRHDTGHGVFLSHLDQTPVEAKRKAFFQGCAFTSVFLAVFIWRLTRVYRNYYFATLSDLSSALSLSGVIWLCIDLYILYLTGPPPFNFVRNSLWYRLRYGFRQTEIVIRRPVHNQLPQFNNMSIAEGRDKFRDQVLRGMDNILLQTKPGDLTSLGFWQVDYSACAEAYDLTSLVGPGCIEEAAWRMAIFTRHGAQPPACWMVHEEWKVHDPARRDRRLALLKENLEALGKGQLFDQWLGMLFASSTTPNGGKKPLSTNMMNEQVAFFQREGVDFKQITDQMSKQVDKEFESSEMPIGF
ncbi:hypothetical protein SCHPADRAFT_993551 [Schizopora paradoxa]|uniref:Uncharacterized protein n=1 Tax=Schizopora paradoxa TaxID=27342 RepID=A0A0H2S3F4_9AGAM|nr:hypothetical protein SCHPADRAFT_993551 [Schizopora paradoxa]